MNDIVQMAILEGAPNLTRKLACHPFSQTAVTNDVVEHLAAVDILSNHVVVVLVHDHLPHAANVRVVKEHGECGLAQRSNLLRGVLGRLLGGCFGRWGACRWVRGYAG